jgi:hypothetical protein
MKNWRQGEKTGTLIRRRRAFLEPFWGNYVNLWSICSADLIENNLKQNPLLISLKKNPPLISLKQI